MLTIETTAVIGEDRTVTVQLPPDVVPGEHRLVVVVEDAARPVPAGPLADFPVDDYGPWPEGLSLRREDMYGANGR